MPFNTRFDTEAERRINFACSNGQNNRR